MPKKDKAESIDREIHRKAQKVSFRKKDPHKQKICKCPLLLVLSA